MNNDLFSIFLTDIWWCLNDVIFVSASADVGFAIWDRYTKLKPNTPPVGYVSHLMGALAGLTIGLLVLKNFEQKLHSQVMWWVALAIYSVCMVFAILWNIFYYWQRSELWPKQRRRQLLKLFRQLKAQLMYQLVKLERQLTENMSLKYCKWLCWFVTDPRFRRLVPLRCQRLTSVLGKCFWFCHILYFCMW